MNTINVNRQTEKTADIHKLGFVILHFNALNETINCINSILKNIDTDIFHIVVVDNGSPNKTGNDLKIKFFKNKKVTIISSNYNIGFANGNNVGIDYLRNEFGADFICCMNNDTILEQKNFFQQIIAAYEKEYPAVIGPKVILRDGSVQQYPNKLFTLIQYKKILADRNFVFNHYYLWQIKKKVLNIKFISKLNSFRHRKNDSIYTSKKNNAYYSVEHLNVVLHGCCLIFTPLFWRYLKGFCTETFLYHEEEILFLDLMENGLKSMYSPNIYIRHFEDAATNMISNSDKEKMLFKTKNEIFSLNILIERLRIQEEGKRI